jgi:hypothetical protein
MVHGQVFATYPAPAVIANALLDPAVPPVRFSQTPGLFLLAPNILFANVSKIKAHVLG